MTAVQRAASAGLAALVLAIGAAPAVASSHHGVPRDPCDPLDPSVCLLPFPNDYFTARDHHTATGLRVDFGATALPANKDGVHIDPSAFNASDGFSPGSTMVTHVPGLDNHQAFVNTGAVPISDMARTFDRDQPVVVINARTRKRQLIYAELDANASSPSQVDLEIHPAVNLREGTRYIVALRRLRDANGNVIPAGQAFREYRDHIRTHDPAIEARRPHMEAVFRTLAKAGIGRRDLYLAWDFTVATPDNIAGAMLHMRDDAFAQLGDRKLSDMRVQGRSPDFTVASAQDFAPCGSDGCQSGENDLVARRVTGTVAVPCYLDQPGCPPGSRLHLGANGLPEQLPGNTFQAPFICNIPRSAVDGAALQPARPSLYGHGLFGSASEVNSTTIETLGNEHDIMLCATDWIGMARPDVPNAITALQDLSHFPTIPDRLQQGLLDFLYLGRAMIHADGFAADPAFQVGGQAVIDTQRLYYAGGSQGGIFGATLSAIAPDFNRAVLGVPGMNYSLLLPRSIDFDQFAAVLYPSYPREIERPLIFALLQMLWDRADPDGYAQHITRDPYPDTPVHQVLLSEAFGDHQVANITTEIEARTIGARIREPTLDPGRSTAVQPFFGIAPITRFPFNGSALVVWDVGPLRTVNGVVKGTTPPPDANVPNRPGVDPHGPDASETVAGRAQASAFLQPEGQSRVIDVCGASPCYLDGYLGPGTGT